MSIFSEIMGEIKNSGNEKPEFKIPENQLPVRIQFFRCYFFGVQDHG